MNPEPRTVNIQQAAELAGVSRRTIFNWMRSGKVQTETAHGTRRIILSTLPHAPVKRVQILHS
jgi:predicted site-specific integrase-resolvase